MEQSIAVYVDLEGIPVKVGGLWTHYRSGRESLSFEYDRKWLSHPKRFSLDPALQLSEGSFLASSDKPLFGAIEDSAPDRWGRLLMRRSERKNAEKEKRKARTLREIDFLLNETHSYLEIADSIRKMSASPKEDLEALWRRMIFNVLISNVDDHLRNHAFLYSGLSGWRLSPAYDLNPTPTDVKPRILSTSIDLIDSSASLTLAVDVARHFDLEASQIKKIVREVGDAVVQWRQEAAKLKIKKREIDRMASAFEHEDLQRALS